MLAILVGLMVVLPPVNFMLAAMPGDDVIEARTIVLQLADDADEDAKVQVILRGGTPGVSVTGNVLVLKAEEEGVPKVWIGVRLTPVPAPLAAHLGEGGVMISNVVQDSPADRAGLQQYDIVIRFDDQEIDGPRDLVDAIADIKAGRSAKLGIIRKAQRRQVKITPIERPAEMDWELKYEEPQEAFVDSDVVMRGLRLMKPGPGGQWTIEELGPLGSLPEVLESLEKLDINIDLDALIDPFDEHMDILSKLHENVRTEITIRVEEDGQSLSINTDADGKIHVKRVDAEGNESSATYDDVEALEEADPEAYELYPGHRSTFLHVRPFGKRALELQREFQIDVEKRVKDALERYRAAGSRYEAQRGKNAQRAREAFEKARIKTLKRTGDEPSGLKSGTVLGARVDDNGAIMVSVRGADGKVTKYRFKSEEALRAAEPELYEEFKDLFE